ncbi:MAG: hypothetical protein A3C35_04880 [Omnitrophica bacterium RIFCSPHIGHO2_02_FULL_46_11]|nr:MAG: hypothetical protein A3C35_04880 [Omnitrophica bacterium RIFCSPHIGHO2_02_FULL_46_11]OGW87772.1 MAG: hypothetical protein A3A81_01570 [Omnitrophica bacterium RIFCSPLOWO2_01_FULL_45_10b]
MIKKITAVLGFFFLVILLIILTSGFWLRPVLAAALSKVTGFPATIQKIHFDLPSSQFGIYGIELKNPAGFGKERFAFIPEAYVDFSLREFLSSRKFHFQEIRFNIDEVTIVKNASGQTNISQLTALKKQKSELKQETEAVKQAPSPQALNFFVDRLDLTVRRVRYVDYTMPKPLEKEIDIHMDHEIFLGISNPLDIVRIIVLKVIYKAALGNLNVPVAQLKEHLDVSLALGQDLAKQGTEIAQAMGADVFSEGTKMVEQVSGTLPVSNPIVDETVQNVKKKTDGIFRGASQLLKSTAESIEEKTKLSSSSNR